MATEIERKFLVTDEPWRGDGAGETIRQGYICAGTRAVGARPHRRRRAFLTLKAPAAASVATSTSTKFRSPTRSEMLTGSASGR